MKFANEERDRETKPISRTSMALFILLCLSIVFLPKDWIWPRLFIALTMLVWTVAVMSRLYARGFQSLRFWQRRARQPRA